METNQTPTQTNTEVKKNKSKWYSWSFEKKALVVLSVVFVAVVLSAWGYAMNLRQTVAANNGVSHVDPGALIEVERIRNLVESQMNNSRSYFLLGSASIFEKQKKEKEELMEALANFEKKYSLPKIPELVKRIRELEQKADEYFEQGIDFREKKTESKIVGQFFQAKTQPIRSQINDILDEAVSLHKAELDRTREEARTAAIDVETQIPKGMTWFTGSIAAIFSALTFLVLRMSRKHALQLAERTRLFEETKKAVQDRDETIFAISHDLKEALNTISTTAQQLTASPQGLDIIESGELVKSSVVTIEGIIKDIRDQKSVDMEGLTLRMDQLSIEDVLESTRQVMQPLAKQRNIRIQIDNVNPPVLAFYDIDRVQRVLSNLISNAIKFSPKNSKVVVKVRSDQKFVNVSVLDTGAGIPADQLPGIFDNYWQAKKTADQGAGIGLSIVKTIVEAHGGTIQVQSQVGRGTTVTFSLPRRRPVGAPMKKSPMIVKTTGYSELGN